ncbi:Exportin-5 [Cichlidogyrus casuarinus]|uniref:Exportin-5 n=1 Tax=Cichlidogyrus casuarinus TaxID=1844966 RepID=A0ABD2QEZ0_9PLAT
MSIGSSGIRQAHLVFSTFSSFVEDVMDFNNIPYERKKDLSYSLKECTPVLNNYIFDLFTKLLIPQINESKAACREALTLASHLVQYFPLLSLLKWSPDSQSSGKAFEIISSFLADTDLRLEAADFFENMLYKNPEFSKMLLVPDKLTEADNLLTNFLFTDTKPSLLLNHLCYFFELELNNCEFAEDRRVFLLRCSRILTRLGILSIECLTSLPHSSTNCSCFNQSVIDLNCRDWVSHVLHVLVKLTLFSIKEISVESADFWALLFRSEQSPINKRIESILPQLFQAWKSAMCRITDKDPVNRDWMNMIYSYEESRHKFALIRITVLNKCFNNFASLHSEFVVNCLLEWLSTLQSSVLNPSPNDFVRDGFPYLKDSFTLSIEWDTLNATIKCLLDCIFKSCEPEQDHVTQTEHYNQVMHLTKLEDLLAVHKPVLFNDLKLRGHFLCVLTQLMQHAGRRHDADSLAAYLDHMFRAVKYITCGIPIANGKPLCQTGGTLLHPRALKEFQTLITSSMFGFVKSGVHRVMSFYDQLFMEVANLWQSDSLGLLPKCVFLEMIILLTLNRDAPVVQQAESLKSIVAFAYEPWMKEESSFLLACQSSANMANFSGLSLALQQDPVAQEKALQFRMEISHTLEAMLSIARRLEAVNNEEQRKLICLPLMEAILLPVVRLIKVVNELNGPEGGKLIHPTLHGVMQLPDMVKRTLLGLPDEDRESNCDTELRNYSIDCANLISLARFTAFMNMIFEKSYLIFAHCVSVLGEKLHTLPLEQEKLIMHQACFSGFDQMPLWRLNFVIRNLLKAFVKSCPKDLVLHSILPIVPPMVDALIQHISQQWNQLNVAKQCAEEANGKNLSDEVLTEELIRTLSRSTIDFLRYLLSFNGREVKMHAEEEQKQIAKLGVTSSIWLGSNDEAFWALLSNGFPRIIIWPDSAVGLRCASLLSSVLELLIRQKNRQFLPIEAARNLLTAVLYALQVYAQEAEPQLHSTLCLLAVQIYQLVDREVAVNELRAILVDALQASNDSDPSTPQKLHQQLLSFENSLFNKPNETERRKRDLFKKLTQSIVGVPLCEKFKVKTKILNPPPINRYKSLKVKTCTDVTEDPLCDLSSFFQQD